VVGGGKAWLRSSIEDDERLGRRSRIDNMATGEHRRWTVGWSFGRGSSWWTIGGLRVISRSNNNNGCSLAVELHRIRAARARIASFRAASGAFTYSGFAHAVLALAQNMLGKT